MSPESELSSSIAADTPDRRHPSTWVSHHRTPETKSTVYGFKEHGDNTSDRQHEEDTATGPPFTPYETNQGIMDDASITPTQLEDIYAQHDLAANCHSIFENDDAPVEMDTSSTGPQPWDKPDTPQAKSVEEVNTEMNNE